MAVDWERDKIPAWQWVNAPNREGDTALHVAAAKGFLFAVTKLLQDGLVDPDIVMDMTYVGVATTPTTNTSDPSSSSSSSVSTSSNSQDSPLTPSPGFSSSSVSSSAQATSTSSQFSSQPSSLSSMTPPTPFTIPHSAYVGDSQASAADFSLGSLPAEFALTPTPREHYPALASTTIDRKSVV